MSILKMFCRWFHDFISANQHRDKKNKSWQLLIGYLNWIYLRWNFDQKYATFFAIRIQTAFINSIFSDKRLLLTIGHTK